MRPFLRFLCYVLGTKLGCALPLRMRYNGMQLVLGRLAGHKTDNCQFYSRVFLVFFFGPPRNCRGGVVARLSA